MTTNTPTTLGRKSKQAVFDTITDAAHTLAVELKYLREADFSELYQYGAFGELENGDEILSSRIGRRLFQPWEMVALLQLGKDYQNNHDIGWADIRWNGLNQPQLASQAASDQNRGRYTSLTLAVGSFYFVRRGHTSPLGRIAKGERVTSHQQKIPPYINHAVPFTLWNTVR